MSEMATSLAGGGRAGRAFYAVARAIVVGFIVAWTRTRVIGKHNVPRSGAFVLAPVHRSYVDTPLAATVTRRRLRFMGKDSMWKLAWFGRIITALGAFPVTRGTVDREAMRRCIEVLQSGEPLVLFPEGERKSGPIVQPLFDGVAYIAVKAGVPIVPVGIGGSERVNAKGSRMLYPRTCVVVVGEPMVAERDADGRVRRSAVKDLTDKLHAELQRLFDDAQLRAGA